MVQLLSELLCAGERWLTDSVGVGLTASDAAMLVPPSSTFFRIRGGDLRVFFSSTVTEESRVWVITGLGFDPPSFAALDDIVVIVLMCGLGVVPVVVVVVIVDVRGDVAFGCYLAWQPIGEFSVMCFFYMHIGIGTLLSQISVRISVRRLSGA